MNKQPHENIALIGISSFGLSLLYISGFFVHMGEAYFMGIYIPATSFDYLQSGGIFWFQVLQSIVQVFTFFLLPIWFDGHDIVLYMILLFLLFFFRSFNCRIKKYFKQTNKLYQITEISLKTISTILTIVFFYFWLKVICSPFIYTDMLFPLNDKILQTNEYKFSMDIKNLEATNNLDNHEKIKHKQAILRSIIVTSKNSEYSNLKKKINTWLSWENTSVYRKSVSFGYFALLCFLSNFYCILIIKKLIRSSNIELKKLLYSVSLRNIIIFFLCSIILFQTCIIPLTYGIIFPNKKYQCIQIENCDIKNLEKRNFIVIGEHSGRIYLYNYYDLWRLNVVSSSTLKEFRVLYKASPLDWIKFINRD